MDEQHPDKKEALYFAAEIGTNVPELDLHGRTAREAEFELDEFIDRQFAAGEKAARIIHGRGSGVLRKRVHAFLDRADQVKAFKNASQPHQIGGVTLVLLDV